MIIPINENEVRKNTPQGPIAVIIKPAIVGPTARLMLLAITLRVRQQVILILILVQL